jgi:hypothetical protein
MFGIGNGNGCTSALTTYAIGIGDGAVANAPTLFGGALAIGKNANASTVTIGTSAFNFATAIGDNAGALGYVSLFGVALQLGEGLAGTFGVGNIAIGVGEGLGHQAAVSGAFGVALQLGPGTTNTIGTLSLGMGVSPGGNPGTATNGFGSVALNLLGGGDSRVEANGFFNLATNILGNDNVVTANGPAGPSLPNVAFNAFGSRNTVKAGPGPLAFAGSIFQTGATVIRAGTGFNINGLAIPGEQPAAPLRSVRPVSAAATAQSAAAKAVSAPATVRGSRKSRG